MHMDKLVIRRRGTFGDFTLGVKRLEFSNKNISDKMRKAIKFFVGNPQTSIFGPLFKKLFEKPF
jgi:hypothetical protein